MPSESVDTIVPRPTRMGVGQMERLLILRSFPGFAELPPEMVNVLADNTRERFFPRGSHLFHAERPVEALQFVVEGRIELLRRGHRYRELGPRSAVGGIAAFARDLHGYDVIALEDCITLEQRIDDAVDIFEDHFPILRGVLRAVAHEVMQLRRHADDKAGFVETLDPGPAWPEAPLDFVERMALIRDTMTFARTRVEAIADLAREAQEVRVSAGEDLWTEGDPSAEMYILICGTVDCRTAEGQSFRFGPGDVIGALDALAAEPRWFTPTVRHDLLALRISNESMYDVFEDNFDIAMDLLEGMAKAVMAMSDAQAGLSPDPSEG